MKINYEQRRLKIQAQLPPNTLFLVTNFPDEDNGETNSNFYYLTGLTFFTPVCLFLNAQGDFGLIADQFTRNPWNGDLLTLKHLTNLGFKNFCLARDLKSFLVNYHHFLIPHPIAVNYQKLTEFFKNRAEQVQISDLLMKARMIKDVSEIYYLKQAAKITAQAFKHIQNVPKINLRERELTGLFNQRLYQQQSNEAFKTIVATGKNTTTLHHQASYQKIQKNDLVLLDAGASFNHYACDVTRVYPAKQFSPAQKKLYRIVLKVQQTVIQNVKPGISFSELQQIADDTTYRALFKLGLLKKPLKQLTIHSIGHWLGLSVHDVGDYRLPLQPGMVLTIEPGIYLGAHFSSPWKNLGIRIEDTVLVTQNGCQVLTAKIPKTIKALEKIYLHQPDT